MVVLLLAIDVCQVVSAGKGWVGVEGIETHGTLTYIIRSKAKAQVYHG